MHAGVAEERGTRQLHQYPHPLLVTFQKCAGHGLELMVDNGGMFVKELFDPETCLLCFVPVRPARRSIQAGKVQFTSLWIIKDNGINSNVFS